MKVSQTKPKRKHNAPVPDSMYAEVFSEMVRRLHARIAKLARKVPAGQLALFSSSGLTTKVKATLVGPGFSDSTDLQVSRRNRSRRDAAMHIVRGMMFPERSSLVGVGAKVRIPVILL